MLCSFPSPPVNLVDQAICFVHLEEDEPRGREHIIYIYTSWSTSLRMLLESRACSAYSNLHYMAELVLVDCRTARLHHKCMKHCKGIKGYNNKSWQHNNHSNKMQQVYKCLKPANRYTQRHTRQMSSEKKQRTRPPRTKSSEHSEPQNYARGAWQW